eukprot:1158098-Pelagomonas_calceolata.AAC.1
MALNTWGSQVLNSFIECATRLWDRAYQLARFASAKLLPQAVWLHFVFVSILSELSKLHGMKPFLPRLQGVWREAESVDPRGNNNRLKFSKLATYQA